MKKKYLVELSEQELAYLHKLISAGSAPARKLNRARILLKADVGKHAEGEAFSDRQIAQMLETSTATVQRARELFYEGGLEAALERSKPDRLYKRSLEGRFGSSPDRPRLLRSATRTGSLVFEASGGQGRRAWHRGEGLA
jgi:Winged helix-turn helix